jgi:hypothetical protein
MAIGSYQPAGRGNVMMQQSQPSSIPRHRAPTRFIGRIAGHLAVASVSVYRVILVLLADALHKIVTLLQQKEKVLQEKETGNTNVRMMYVLLERDERETEARKWVHVISRMSVQHKLAHVPAGVRGYFYVSRQ